MKSVTVRLPLALAAEIDSEARARGIPKSDVVRERLQIVASARQAVTSETILDLIGSVDGLPPDLSGQKKRYLRMTGYGRKRTR